MLFRTLFILLLSIIGQPAFAGFKLSSNSTTTSHVIAAEPRHFSFNPWKRETKEERKKSILSKLSLGLVFASGIILLLFFIYALAALAGSVAAALTLEKLVTTGYAVYVGLNMAGVILGIVALCMGQKKKGFAIAAIILGGLCILPFLASLFL